VDDAGRSVNKGDKNRLSEPGWPDSPDARGSPGFTPENSVSREYYIFEDFHEYEIPESGKKCPFCSVPPPGAQGRSSNTPSKRAVYGSHRSTPRRAAVVSTVSEKDQYKGYFQSVER
jgi:hypothetical protein